MQAGDGKIQLYGGAGPDRIVGKNLRSRTIRNGWRSTFERFKAGNNAEYYPMFGERAQNYMSRTESIDYMHFHMLTIQIPPPNLSTLSGVDYQEVCSPKVSPSLPSHFG